MTVALNSCFRVIVQNLGEMLSLGGMTASLASPLFGVNLGGEAAHAARRIAYLIRMPTTQHKAKVIFLPACLHLYDFRRTDLHAHNYAHQEKNTHQNKYAYENKHVQCKMYAHENKFSRARIVYTRRAETRRQEGGVTDQNSWFHSLCAG